MLIVHHSVQSRSEVEALALLAAMANGGDDAQDHSDWRVMAKSLADEVLKFRNNEIF